MIVLGFNSRKGVDVRLRYLAVLLGLASPMGCGPAATSPPAGGATTATSADVATAAADLPAPPDPIVDLRTLPALEQAKYVIRAAHRIEGISRGTAPEIFSHYRAALEKLGCQLAAPLAKSDVTDEAASTLLIKDENAIFLSTSPLLQTIDGKTPATEDQGTRFSIDYLGTSDSSKLPQLPGAEKGFGGRVTTVYFADMNAAATVASVRNMLAVAGWQEYESPAVTKYTLHRFVRTEFRKDGCALHVLISEARADPNKPQAQRSSVKYAIGAIGHALPAPADATDVQFDDAAWSLRCDIPREMEPVVKYYISAMAAQGFHAPRDVPFSETNMVIKCESSDKDFVIVKLNYAGLSTHAELQGVAAEDRKAAGM